MLLGLQTDLKDAVLSADELVAIIDQLRTHSAASFADQANKSECFLDLVDDFSNWTGLTKVQFQDLLKFVQVNEQDDAKNRVVLGAYLMHMHTALAENKIAALLSISQSTVSRYISLARDHLLQSFVPIYLNRAVNREKVFQESTKIARTIHGISDSDSKIMTVWDGTYLYLNKSVNFAFQRATFGGQKKTNYVKPMLAVTTNGLIIDVFGPDELWAGSVGDGDILQHIMSTPLFKNFFIKGDVFVLDRGFERRREDLENLGFEVSIPTCSKGKAQLTAYEANQSRLCTKLRWVIESVNSSLKRFKYFKTRIPALGVPHLYDDVKIAAAVHNAFFKRLSSDGDDPQVAVKMLQHLNTPNIIQGVVEKGNLIRRTSQFQIMNSSHFEQITAWSPEIVKSFAEPYQLKWAKNYISDHFNKAGDNQFYISKDDLMPDFSALNLTLQSPIFVKAKQVSRHKSNKVYNIFILIDAATSSSKAVVGRYCTCLNGARTVCPCSHVVAIVWYLFFGRHLEDLESPAAFLQDCFPMMKRRDNQDDASEGDVTSEQDE
nr:PREDICTED: uncharacterized protein LOC109037192 [Bemisia tabaci]